MRIRPCIDIHDGKVKQIVGSTLHDEENSQALEKDQSLPNERRCPVKDPQGQSSQLVQNFVSSRNADYYASLYREKDLSGGHCIMLNSSGEKEAYAADRQQVFLALEAFPGGMQVGGGITPDTAGEYLERGASHVIVTSYVFRDGRLDMERLQEMLAAVGRGHLVLDLSCRRMQNADEGEKGAEEAAAPSYRVVTDRWQKVTSLQITAETLDFLSLYCDEFLIHAADVEGKRRGIEKELVRLLGDWQKSSKFPITYAGGVHSLKDLEVIRRLSGGEMDVTVGSALKLFGGDLELDELIKETK